ncbi:MAG: hypothetical protein SF028_14115 [Candidatus Sumerlaeia bacterium]|nr:hypothetical protein [Candidatus Sumerlaeia bacterium]
MNPVVANEYSPYGVSTIHSREAKRSTQLRVWDEAKVSKRAGNTTLYSNAREGVAADARRAPAVRTTQTVRFAFGCAIFVALVVAWNAIQGFLPASLESRIARVRSDLGGIRRVGLEGASGLPDPFSKQATDYRVDPARGLVWSLGPDLLDQHGLLEYDPTNGITSTGDITLVLSR